MKKYIEINHFIEKVFACKFRHSVKLWMVPQVPYHFFYNSNHQKKIKMTVKSIKIVIDEFYECKSVVIFCDGEETIIEMTSDEEALETILRALGFKSVARAVDEGAAAVKMLNPEGQAVVVEMLNEVTVDSAGSRNWDRIGIVKADGIVTGSYSLSTAFPLMCSIESLCGVLSGLGFQVAID